MPPAQRTTTAKKTTAKKSSAKKSAAKKSTATKAPATRSTAKKSTAKKSTAKKSTAKKTTAKKTTAAPSATAQPVAAAPPPAAPAAAETTVAQGVAFTAASVEEAVERIRGLQAGLLDAARSGGAAYLQAYETALSSMLELTKGAAESTQLSWPVTLVNTYSDFVKRVNEAVLSAGRYTLG